MSSRWVEAAPGSGLSARLAHDGDPQVRVGPWSDRPASSTLASWEHASSAPALASASRSAVARLLGSEPLVGSAGSVPPAR